MPRYFAPEERYNKFKAWREQRNLDAAGQGPQAPADPVWQSVARNVGTGPAPVLPPAPQPTPMPPPQLSVSDAWMQPQAPAIAPSTPVPSSMTVPSAWLAPYNKPAPLRLPKVPAFSAPTPAPPDGMNWQTADQMATPPTPTIPMPTRPYRNEVVDADLDALAAVPRDLAGAGLGAYNEFIGRPVTGLATELTGGREQEAYERQRGLPERADTGGDLGNWWRALSERQRARSEAGIASVPLGDVLPFTPGEYAGIARGVAPVARGLLGEVGAAAKSAPVAGAVRAADRAITSPSLKRLVPGATVEDVSKTAVPESWQTKGAQLQLGYGGDRDAFAISSKDASATGYLRNADFPNEAGRPDRGELFFVTAGPVQGTGIGTSLARDAIDLMVKNGATSVNVSITTEAGRNLVGRLLREGDIAGPIKTSPTGKAEYQILRGQNIIASTLMGTPPEIGGAVAGGAYGAAQPAESEQERAQNIIKGAAGGALVGSGARAAGKVIASKGGKGPFSGRLGLQADADEFAEAVARRQDEIQVRQAEIEAKLQAIDEAVTTRREKRNMPRVINRPSFSGSATNEEVEQIAKERGLNAYADDLEVLLDPESFSQRGPGQRSGKAKIPPSLTKEEQDELKALQAEYKALNDEVKKLNDEVEAGYQAALEKPAAPPAGVAPEGAQSSPVVPPSSGRTPLSGDETPLSPSGNPPETIVPPAEQGGASTLRGRALFTPEQLAEFDRLGIDVSNVPEQYKSEALGQLTFQQQNEVNLASPDYNDKVRAEYAAIEARSKERTPGAFAPTEKSSSSKPPKPAPAKKPLPPEIEQPLEQGVQQELQGQGQPVPPRPSISGARAPGARMGASEWQAPKIPASDRPSGLEISASRPAAPTRTSGLEFPPTGSTGRNTSPSGAPPSGGSIAPPTKESASSMPQSPKDAGLREGWDRVRNVIEAQGPAGKVLGTDLHRSRDIAEKMAGRWVLDMPTVRDLGKTEFENFVDVAEGTARPVNTRVQAAVNEWKRVREEIYNRARAGDLDVGHLDNYFPHSYDPKMFQGRNWASAVEHLIKTGQAKDALAAGEILRNSRDVIRNRRQKNLEIPRLTDLPGYQKTKAALFNYVESAADRIAGVEVFGKGDTKAIALINKIAEEGGDAEAVKHLFNIAVGAQQYGENLKTISKAVRSYNTLTKLGLGALTNATQPLNTATVVGGLRTIFKTPEAMFSKEVKDFALEAGVTLDGVLNDVREGTGIGTKVGKIGAPGFNLVEKWNRTLTAWAGRDYAIDMAQRAANGDGRAVEALQTMRLDAQAIVQRGGKLTREDELDAARNIVERTQFKVDAQDLPGWADSPLGKAVMQFRTFAYNQSAFMAREIIQPALRGNVKPLLRFLIYGLPAGAATVEMQNFLRNRPSEEDPAQRVRQWYQRVGALGVVGDVLAGLAPPNSKYLPAERYALQASSVAFGPTMSSAQEGIGMIASASQGKPEGIERFLLKQIPIVGPTIKNTVLPYKPSAPTTGGGASSGRRIIPYPGRSTGGSTGPRRVIPYPGRRK